MRTPLIISQVPCSLAAYVWHVPVAPPSIDLRLKEGTASRTFVLELRNAAGPM